MLLHLHLHLHLHIGELQLSTPCGQPQPAEPPSKLTMIDNGCRRAHGTASLLRSWALASLTVGPGPLSVS
jgi:hypothetical protein